MMINYQKQMEDIIAQVKANSNSKSNLNANREKSRSSLLLHSCCAPCSSYVLKYLAQYFDITVFYYNINIFPADEYNKRVLEQERFVNKLNLEFDSENKNTDDFVRIKLIKGSYDFEKFFELARGLEAEPEGGERCKKCFWVRLEETAEIAKSQGFDYFTTTLTTSPHKNANLINQIGQKLEEKYGVKYLYSDFKKKDGYKKSIEMSKKYNLYRQNYCGCVFSRKQIYQNN